MSLQCPRCHSPKVASFHHAMKVGAAIGTVGGAARGISAALAGIQAGALVGAFAGPAGIALGSTATTMAIMTAVAREYGRAHKAFIIVPLACGMFIDIVNSLAITIFATL